MCNIYGVKSVTKKYNNGAEYTIIINEMKNELLSDITCKMAVVSDTKQVLNDLLLTLNLGFSTVVDGDGYSSSFRNIISERIRQYFMNIDDLSLCWDIVNISGGIRIYPYADNVIRQDDGIYCVYLEYYMFGMDLDKSINENLSILINNVDLLINIDNILKVEVVV